MVSIEQMYWKKDNLQNEPIDPIIINLDDDSDDESDDECEDFDMGENDASQDFDDDCC